MPYEPLSSVWEGSDAALCEKILKFYPHKEPRIVVDATANAGRFWRGTTRHIITLDCVKAYRPMCVADNRAMPFKDESIDVIFFDPPHSTDHDTKNNSQIWTKRFGLLGTGNNPFNLYVPFLREAARTLTPEGVLVAKITNHIHNHRMQWAVPTFVRDAESCALVCCDEIVKIRSHSMRAPQWENAHHTRRHHVTYIICRKGKSCE